MLTVKGKMKCFEYVAHKGDADCIKRSTVMEVEGTRHRGCYGVMTLKRIKRVLVCPERMHRFGTSRGRISGEQHGNCW